MKDRDQSRLLKISVEADRSYEADSQTSPVPTATPNRC